jgi:hypothetical protein
VSDSPSPSAAVFSPRLLLGWAGVAVLLFFATLYAMGGGKLPGAHPDSVGPSSFSHSAIGYAGLAESLRRRGIPVISSEYDAVAKLTPGSALVIAEPQFQGEDVARSLLVAKKILLVLPKWQGKESATHRGWIANVEKVPGVAAQLTLALLNPGGTVIRKDEPPSWTVNRFAVAPTIEAPVQLMKSTLLRPLIASEDGMLLGELPDKTRRIWILADPDILNNYGLPARGNAALAFAILDSLRGSGDSRIVFDETVHGFVAAPPTSPFMLLFRFPFVVATAQGVVAIALLLWATMGRFGAPDALPPPLAAGKEGLIRNAARLLEFGGNQPVIMQRYVQALFRGAARELHAPAGLAGEALLEWLRRVGAARGITIDCVRLGREVDAIAADRRRNPSALVRLVAEAHRWKQGIVDGRGKHSRDH